MKKLYFLFFCCQLLRVCFAQPGISAPLSATEPGKYQLQQIERKYGMFIHFSINTFYDDEWSDGSLPPSLYNPLVLMPINGLKRQKMQV